MHRAIIIAASAMLGVAAIQAHAQTAQTGTQVFTDPNGFEGKETPGGYEPAKPAVPSTLPADARVVFVPQTLTPTEAYPPPPPQASYPPCTAKRRTSCQQR